MSIFCSAMRKSPITSVFCSATVCWYRVSNVAVLFYSVMLWSILPWHWSFARSCENHLWHQSFAQLQFVVIGYIIRGVDLLLDHVVINFPMHDVGLLLGHVKILVATIFCLVTVCCYRGSRMATVLCVVTSVVSLDDTLLHG